MASDAEGTTSCALGRRRLRRGRDPRRLRAGRPPVAVTNDYTAGQDLTAAALVVDSFDRLHVEALRQVVGAAG